jgi:xyloglucan-specific endo-beta-1,4-glucanase
MTERICKNGDFLITGKYCLLNNLWGADTGSGSQCIWKSPSGQSRIAWGTEWDWMGRSDTIKSYAAVVWGWHWCGRHWDLKVADAGLPVGLGSLKSLRVAWSFNVTHARPGGMNVTYDIWLSGNPDPGDKNPTGEVMIWLYKSGDIRPIRARQTGTVIGNTEWDFWQGPHPVSGWPVYSFIRTVNTQSETLDITDFFQYLISSAGLESSVYLIGVQAGPEVFTGKGRLDTALYSLDI